MEIEIWSDVACPWCYVGKRRFESALEQFEHGEEVNVTWRSFELDPGAPPERFGDRAERLAAKYGMTVERAREAEGQLTAVAAGEGLEFHFDRARSGNTFDAHRVVHLAAEHGVQDAVKERLLRAYFSEGELMSDHATLARLAGEAGLPAEEVSAMLASERFGEDVREDERTAARLGISAVPTFVLDRALGASGAQSPPELLALLRRRWAESQPAALATDAGAS